MDRHNETPHLLGSSKNGGSVIQSDWTHSEYRNPSLSAMDLAAIVVARRFRLSASHARTVCELAGIGGSV